MKKSILIFSSILFLMACVPKEKPGVEVESIELTPSEEFIAAIETAHKSNEYSSKEMIQFDMNLVFGGKKRFEGTILMTPSGGLVKMVDSTKTLIWDGKDDYSSDTTYKRARFALLTWSYFFAAAHKLNDPGSNMEMLGSKKLNDLDFDAGKLTFGDGVGDSPEDWYIAYKDKESNLLAAMAYIVTASSSVEEAEEDPHAITYEAYDNIDGIPFATQWNFWTWNDAGQLNKLLGSASISNIQFKKMEQHLFKMPV